MEGRQSEEVQGGLAGVWMVRRRIRFKVGDAVVDAWWPWHIGYVEKVLKTRVHVRWQTQCYIDKLWRYDKAHMKYLMKV